MRNLVVYTKKTRVFIISQFIALIALFVFAPLDIGSGILANEAKEINIVTSFYPVYIIAKNVTRDVPGVAVKNLTPPLTGCLHDYSLTANDMRKLADAQVFVANGAGMESFLDRVISQRPDIKLIRLSEGIPLIKGEGNEGYNPHIWVSVSGAIIQVKNLGKAMEKFDPSHKELYEKNTDNYAAELEALRRKMRAELAPYKGSSIITFHEAFAYFARDFDFKIAAVVEREPGSEPCAREFANTIELIKKNDISAIFSEPQYPSEAAKTIARETGARIYVLDPAVTGPDDCDAYINIMEKNLKTLKQALQKQ